MTASQTHIDKYFDFQPRTFAKFASKRLAAAIPGAAHPGNEPQAQQPHLRLPMPTILWLYSLCIFIRQAVPNSNKGARAARGRGRGRGGRGRGRPGQGKRAATPLEADGD